MGRRLVLFASDLAACIGRNKYESRDNMKLKYLRRFDEGKYKEINASTKEEQTERAIAEVDSRIKEGFIDHGTKTISETIDTMTSEVISNDGRTLQESVRRVQSDIADMCKEQLDTATIGLINEHVRKRAYTDLGTAKEALIASLYQDKKRVRLVKDDAFVKITLGSVHIDGEIIDVYVGGKCDGIVVDDMGTRELVEIKNRTRRLFYRVPDYEKVQFLTYMYIYGLVDGVLVERFQETIHEHPIRFDQQEFAIIKDLALDFATDVVKLGTGQ